MIRLIEALDFRCLRYVRQPLGPFHVLVGPNASGKTTFLDVLVFLGQLVNDGLEAAVSERTQNFHDLTWNRRADRFELAVEATLPGTERDPACDGAEAGQQQGDDETVTRAMVYMRPRLAAALDRGDASQQKSRARRGHDPARRMEAAVVRIEP